VAFLEQVARNMPMPNVPLVALDVIFMAGKSFEGDTITKVDHMAEFLVYAGALTWFYKQEVTADNTVVGSPAFQYVVVCVHLPNPGIWVLTWHTHARVMLGWLDALTTFVA
jgi:hypothetical protein